MPDIDALGTEGRGRESEDFVIRTSTRIVTIGTSDKDETDHCLELKF